MPNSLSTLNDKLLQISESVSGVLRKTKYVRPESTNICVKSILESLIPRLKSPQNPNITEERIRASVKDFTLACALLCAAESSTHDLLAWVPQDLSTAVNSAFREVSVAYINCFGERNAKKIGGFNLDSALLFDENRLVIELMPDVLPLLKDRIKESSIDRSAEADEISAASARVPVGYAIIAAYQFRWFACRVDYPHLGKLCSLVIPCALTCLDHWSPEVKGQGMISFTHLAKNVDAAELGLYEDVILDACCQNIASSDDIWHLVVEMSVLLVTCTQRSNPRSPWYERLLSEMLSHMERQPRNKERRISWLKLIEPLFNGVGLVLLAHFRRIFPLFFKWMHADDDETVLLVLKRIDTILRLTWIRNTPYVDRLVDELAVLYKEAALKSARVEIRRHVLQILVLLQQCKGMQFEAAWEKHKNDPDLTGLGVSVGEGFAGLAIQ